MLYVSIRYADDPNSNHSIPVDIFIESTPSCTINTSALDG